MSVASTDGGLVDRLIEPLSRCIRGRGEEDLLSLRADAALQARIDELADRCDEGTLTPEEREEYETYVQQLVFWVGMTLSTPRERGPVPRESLDWP